MKKRIFSTLLILTIVCTTLVGCKFTISIGDNNYDKYTWAENQNWKTNNNIEVTVVNGVIDEISLDHRNY